MIQTNLLTETKREVERVSLQCQSQKLMSSLLLQSDTDTSIFSVWRSKWLDPGIWDNEGKVFKREETEFGLVKKMFLDGMVGSGYNRAKRSAITGIQIKRLRKEDQLMFCLFSGEHIKSIGAFGLPHNRAQSMRFLFISAQTKLIGAPGFPQNSLHWILSRF